MTKSVIFPQDCFYGNAREKINKNLIQIVQDIWKSGEKFEKSTGIKTILGENNRFCHNKNGLKKQDPLKKMVKKL